MAKSNKPFEEKVQGERPTSARSIEDLNTLARLFSRGMYTAVIAVGNSAVIHPSFPDVLPSRGISHCLTREACEELAERLNKLAKDPNNEINRKALYERMHIYGINGASIKPAIGYTQELLDKYLKDAFTDEFLERIKDNPIPLGKNFGTPFYCTDKGTHSEAHGLQQVMAKYPYATTFHIGLASGNTEQEVGPCGCCSREFKVLKDTKGIIINISPEKWDNAPQRLYSPSANITGYPI